MQTDPQSADPKLRYRCRHLFADGHRCGSPALRNEPFCYYHHTSRRPAPAPGKFRHIDAWEPFTLPIVEDRASALQVASLILNRIASNDLDPNRAGPLISTLRAAIACLPREPRPAAAKTPATAQPPNLIDHPDDPILDETHGFIALIAELPLPQPPVPTAPSSAPALETSAAPDQLAPGLPLKSYDEYTKEEFYRCMTVFGGEEPEAMPYPASLTQDAVEAHYMARRTVLGMPLTLPPKAPLAPTPPHLRPGTWPPNSTEVPTEASTPIPAETSIEDPIQSPSREFLSNPSSAVC
jgi:hypothetical protein